jgi:hypothetical protein
LLQEEANGDDEWHYSKKGDKPAPQQRRQSPEKTREVRAKYNFLEDAKRSSRFIKLSREHSNLSEMSPKGKSLNNSEKE